MKITIVAPKPNTGGGIRVISLYAKMLIALGHEVTVLAFIHKGSVKERLKSRLLNFTSFCRIGLDTKFFEDMPDNSFKLKELNVAAPRISSFPSADIIIATWWETAEWVEKLPQNRGKKVHFIQGYEIFPYTPKERVKAVYNSNSFNRIAVSSWLKNIIEIKHNKKDVLLLPNGIDTSAFGFKAKSRNSTFCVGTLYSSHPTKNSERAIKAFEQAKNQMPNLKLIGFGNSEPIDKHHLNSFDTFVVKPDQEQIAKIYQSADVWLFPSDQEGFGLPILEALSCGTPVIATPAGAAPELLTEGGGSLLSNFCDKQMAKEILKYEKLDKEQHAQVCRSARQVAEKHTWSNLAKQLENYLFSIVNEK